MESDMSGFMGGYARVRVVEDAAGIASDMGLEYVRTLSREDLSRMAGGSLDPDTGRSFRNADLVIEASRWRRHPVRCDGDFLHGRPEGTGQGRPECESHHPIHQQDCPSGNR